LSWLWCRLTFPEQFVGSGNDIFQSDLGFNEVFVSSKLFGPGAVFCLAKGGQHDHASLLKAVSITQDVEHFKAADLGHHDIRNNQVWFFFGSHCQGRLTVGCGYDFVAFGFHTRLVDLAQISVVFDK
jgi:hypothetical protein